VKDWVGGALTGSICCVPAQNYCTYYTGGSGYTRENNSAVTWTNGLEMGGPIGINLSIRTGYNNQTKITYNFPQNSELCGTSNYPTSGAQISARDAK